MRFLARFCVVLCYVLIIIPIIFVALIIYHTVKDWLHKQG